jgi:hypothetical protein
MPGMSQEPLKVPSAAFPFAALHEVNERCIELLVNEARAEKRPPMPLVIPLRELLRNTGPEARRRAAQRGLLLIDMEFQDAEWWRAVRTQPEKQWRTTAWRGSFPRRSAVPLGRATLMLAWHSLHADRDTSCVLLGMTAAVAELIANLQLVEIDQIANRRFRHVQPRWHDQPSIWRTLLLAAQVNKADAMRDFNLHGLQLMTGRLLSVRGDDRIHEKEGP